MLRNWRSWVLLALFFGPFLVYIGMGLLWLKDRGWIWMSAAGVLSIIAGVAFTLLMSRWTTSTRSFLPPIDWDVPSTFSEFDRKAWELVEAEAAQGENLDMASLTGIDTYVETGKRLAMRLAAHYHPLSADPIDRVPLIELLTALELAAEDLTHLTRQVPGGDLVTLADYKRAVVAANYIQKASDIYTYLLPIFNPVTGLSRLASQHLMVKPAWKNMQQNVLRWFHRAFVSRLGTHLVELYSGRLVIGSDKYRKLTRKLAKDRPEPESLRDDLTIVVAGSKVALRGGLLGAIKARIADDPSGLAARLAKLGGDPIGLERLLTATWVEAEYTASPTGKESARDRSTRRHAVARAVDADLLIVAIDPRLDHREADPAFARAWVAWFATQPTISIPPALALVAGPDTHEAKGQVGAIREALPAEVAPILAGSMASGLEEWLLPTLTIQCQKAERGALLRHIRDNSARSKAGRLMRQVGDHGRSVFQTIRDRKKAADQVKT